MGIGIRMKSAILVAAVVLCLLCFKVEVRASENGEGSSLSQTTVEASEFVSIEDEDVPLGVLPKHAGVSWWWLTIVIAVGAVGGELISRREVRENKKKKTFESLSDITRPF